MSILPHRLAAALLVLPAALPAQPPAASTSPVPHRPAQIREILRHECTSRYGHRGVVLFSDGMIRLKDGPPGQERMTLHKLDPDRFQGFLHRLEAEVKPDSGDLHTHGPSGAGVEACKFRLSLPGSPVEDHPYGRYDALPLWLSRLVGIAEDLARTAEEAIDLEAFPADYEPAPGDVLERHDAVRFVVLRQTSDGGGVELRGIEQPLTLYVPKGAIRSEFARLVSRRER